MKNKSKTTGRNEDGQSALVPKLRFPEFLEAEGWASELMGSVYSFKGNNSLSRDKLNYAVGSVKNIHYGDIHTKFSTHFDIRKETVPYINPSESVEAFKAEKFCIEGDIIFADASEDLEDIGKAIEIVGLNGEAIVSGLHTILARQIGANLVLGFGGHLFKSNWVRTQIQKESQGSKVLGLSGGRLAKINIPFPHSRNEQQKIADCLSSLDELIAAQARKVGTLKTHKKGLMQQLFPREGETQPRLRFPEFHGAGAWEVGKLEDLAKRGSGHTPSKSSSDYYDGGIKWVSLADSKYLDAGFISTTKIEISKQGIKNSSAVLHPAGTVLISRDAGVGKSAVMGIPMAVSQHFIVWTCNPSLLSNWFLYHLLQKMKPVFERNATGSTIKTIGLPFFKELCVSVPSVPEQQRIADCLNSLDNLITAATQDLETLKTHKKGLMQQLFPSAEAVEA